MNNSKQSFEDDEEYEEDSIEMKQNDELFEKFSEPIFYGQSKNQFLVQDNFDFENEFGNNQDQQTINKQLFQKKKNFNEDLYQKDEIQKNVSQNQQFQLNKNVNRNETINYQNKHFPEQQIQANSMQNFQNTFGFDYHNDPADKELANNSQIIISPENTNFKQPQQQPMLNPQQQKMLSQQQQAFMQQIPIVPQMQMPNLLPNFGIQEQLFQKTQQENLMLQQKLSLELQNNRTLFQQNQFFQQQIQMLQQNQRNLPDFQHQQIKNQELMQNEVQLRQEIDDLRKKVLATFNEKNQVLEVLKEQSNKIRELNEELLNKDNCLEEKLHQIHQLELNCKQFQNDMNNQQNSNRCTELQIELENSKQNFESEIQKKTIENQQLRAKIAHLEVEQDRFISQIQQQKQVISQQCDELENLRVDYYNEKSNKTEKNSRESNMSNALEKANYQINQLGIQLKKSDENNKKLQEENKAISNQLNY